MSGLFRKGIEKRCAYCASGVALNDCEVACSRHGIVDSAGHCRHFAYDPLKRVPPRPAVLEEKKHSPEEFEL